MTFSFLRSYLTIPFRPTAGEVSDFDWNILYSNDDHLLVSSGATGRQRTCPSRYCFYNFAFSISKISAPVRPPVRMFLNPETPSLGSREPVKPFVAFFSSDGSTPALVNTRRARW